MHVHNTESGRLEELVPRVPGRIGMYVCGPTVYAAPHLGHARMAIAFDVIRKYLAFSGFEVTFVSNYTDVDDKIILRAREEGIAPTAVAGKYEQAWERAMGALRVRPPDVVPRATEHIPQMLELVERLIERGFAYPADGDVYFAVERFPGYGRLSHQSPADLRAGARVEPGERKRNPLDFVLWKGAKEGEPAWESPWGPGRPGWHIECSAMSLQYLGMGFDIHGAGSDLVFPHHENELAQAEAASGESPFVRYWIHSGLVSLGGDKMSKSTGNLVSADEALARYTPEAIRLLALQTHYRSPLDFSEELIADAATAVRRLASIVRPAAGAGDAAPPALSMAYFRDAMDDDFGTPGALAALFDAVRRGNVALEAGDSAEAAPLRAAVLAMDAVLSVVPAVGAADADAALVGDLVALALELREAARGERDFAAADRVRDRLTEIGIIVEDTPAGARWHRGSGPAAGAGTAQGG